MLAGVLLAVALGVVASLNDPVGARSVMDDLNHHRRDAALAVLVSDPALDAVALERADDMRRRGYFDHVNPDGRTAFDALNARAYAYHAAAENIALAPSVAEANRGLWLSAGHRENILSERYRRVGIAVVAGDGGRIYVVELFSD
jgi:uncharacterized protein YkwD